MNRIFIIFFISSIIKLHLLAVDYSKIKYEGEKYVQGIEKFSKEQIEPNSIIFLGDSITANAPFYSKNLINRGINSDLTYGVLMRLDEIIKRNPKKVFIMVGINDIDHVVSNEHEFDIYIYDISKDYRTDVKK